MSIKSFLKFVEIQTKLASVIPFILGTLYASYRYESFIPLNFIIMFISLFCFDMVTTAINNYIDFKKSHKKEGYGYEEHNAMVRDGIKESNALAVIFALLMIAVSFGILLTIRTNLIVLLIGVISFAVGILYTFGPVPISRMPLGEAFSGVFMGFIIMFLSIYIHIFDKNVVVLNYANNILSLNINLVEVVYIFLFSIPAVVGIANIMLANNICDVEDDIVNRRFTLPYFIGRKNALLLFKVLYFIGYIDIIILLVLNIAPMATLLVILTIIPLIKNIKAFSEKPVKSENFALAVKNFFLMNASQVFLTGITLIIKHYK